MRTRVKFCGFTREPDIQIAVALGVDALGFVLYEKSPRYVSAERVAQLCAHVPAFVNIVGLFVNSTVPQITRILSKTPISTIQLHGDESWNFALNVKKIMQRPVIKAVRVNPQTDWDEVAHYIEQLSGVLLDADSSVYGGSGQGFDWRCIPINLRGKIILSGGLSVDTVKNAIDTVAPYAVDVSSGIESAKGIKDAEKMRAFISQVKGA